MTNAVYQSKDSCSNYNSNNFNQRLEVTRGDIFLADLGMTKGSIQGGERPVIIVSNEQCNNYSGVVHIVPITSKLNKKKLPTHIEIPNEYGLDFNSIALCEQQQPINKFSLKYKLGRCSEELMIQINKGLKIQLDLLEDETENRNTYRKPNNYPVPRRTQQEVFDFTKAKRIARTVNELERNMIKYKLTNNMNVDLYELKNDIKEYLMELKNYCNKFNKDYQMFYTPISDVVYSKGDGVIARAI